MSELSSGFGSRLSVREHIEERLDAMRPAEERAKEWGRQVTPEQWEAMRKQRRGRG